MQWLIPLHENNPTSVATVNKEKMFSLQNETIQCTLKLDSELLILWSMIYVEICCSVLKQEAVCQ